MTRTLRIHPDDNVAVALDDLPAGGELGDAIPRGHKVALAAISAGSSVIKYGHPIGRASRDIAPGDHVHAHNLASMLDGDAANAPAIATDRRRAGNVPPARRTFDGYRRPDGRVGVRNEIWVINTVACVNQASERIARAAH